jgi:hypothetical protein
MRSPQERCQGGRLSAESDLVLGTRDRITTTACSFGAVRQRRRPVRREQHGPCQRRQQLRQCHGGDRNIATASGDYSAAVAVTGNHNTAMAA